MSEKRNMLKELQEMGWTAKDIHNLLKELEAELAAKDAAQVPDTDKDTSRVELEQKITKLMTELGFTFNIKGTPYIREAICYAVKNGTDYMTKELYPFVAKKFHTTSSRVERAIRHAIERAFDGGNPELLELFGYSISQHKGKPTNSEFIALIADQIKQGLL